MWRRRRRIAALAQGVLGLGLPFVRVGGESAFRFDLPTLTLHAFGTSFPIERFGVVLAGTLFLLLLAVWVTVVFGRLWCGFACPQTVIPELAAWASEAFPAEWRKGAARILLVPLSALVALSLVAAFVPPDRLPAALASSPVAAGAFLALWGSVFAMTALAGRAFCRLLCPYAMLQNAVIDRDTLAVAFDARRAAECLRCGMCVRACPVGIDVREGLRRECLACAACIDACRGAAAEAGVSPFVAYRGRVARGRTWALGGAAALAGAALVALSLAGGTVDFTVQWSGAVPGSGTNSYRYAVRNDLDRPLALSLAVEGGGTLVGGRDIVVAPGERRTGSVLVRGEAEAAGQVTFVLTGPGLSIRRKAGYL